MKSVPSENASDDPFSRAIGYISRLDRLLERIGSKLSSTSNGSAEDRAAWETISADLLSAGEEQAAGAHLLRLIMVNPTLFRRMRYAGLDEVWELKSRWDLQIEKLNRLRALYVTRTNKLAATVAALPAPDVVAKLSSASSQLAAVSKWTDILADATRYFAERAARTHSASKHMLSERQLERDLSPLPVDKALLRSYAIIQKSGAFDSVYYRSQFSDGLPAVNDLILHYLCFGWKMGINPHPLFSIDYYVRQRPQFSAGIVDPLSDFLTLNSHQIINPHPFFITTYYLTTLADDKVSGNAFQYFVRNNQSNAFTHPLFDVKYYSNQAEINFPTYKDALTHYLTYGWHRGLSFSRMFDVQFYRSQLLLDLDIEPFTHFVMQGAKSGLLPNPLFDTQHYISLAPRLFDTHPDPLTHYLLIGEEIGLAPSRFFDPDFYKEGLPKEQRDTNSLLHYLTVGGHDDRDPVNGFRAAEYRQAFMAASPDRRSLTPMEYFLTVGATELNSAFLREFVLPSAETKTNSDVSSQPSPSANGPLGAPEPAPARAQLPGPAPGKSELTEAPKPRPSGNQQLLMLDLTPEEIARHNFKQYPGKCKILPERPFVMLVAHAAGEQLFGSERSFLDMVEGLHLLGLNIAVILPRNIPDYTNAIRAKSQYVATFNYDWWRKDDEESPEAIELFSRLINFHNIDVVHVNTLMLRECLTAARACNVSSVVHIRELIGSDLALQELIGRSGSDIIAEVTKNADWVICNSNTTAKNFNKPGRTFVVPNMVHLEHFKFENKLTDNKVRFGLISSNIPKKGISDVVTLAKLVENTAPNAEFLLIGPETDIVRGIKADQAAGTAPRNIIFPGYARTPMDAVAQVNVVLTFSHFAESFGRTALEAMAAERPVIGYRHGAIPELVRHGVNGYLVPLGEPEAAVPYIEELCTDPKRVALLGASGRSIAERNYGLESYVKAFDEAYGAILADVTARRAPSFMVDVSNGPIVRPARRAGLKEVEVKPRVAYFCWHFPVPSETFVLNELRLLVAEGVDVIVFCRQTPHKNFKPDFPITFERVSSVEQLAVRIKETDRTIVHAHFVYPTVTDMVWPACEIAQIPFTFIAHAQDIFKYDNDRLNRLAEIGASPLCRAMFTLSNYHLEFVVARGFPRSKVIINPNAVDTDKFTVRDFSSVSRQSRRVIAVHRFVPKKGLDLLIRSAQYLMDLDIQIDIYGYGDLEEQYKAIISELGLTNVHLRGALTQDQVAEVMGQADLFACPCVQVPHTGDMDGLPTSLIEGMAAGVPVLTTDVGAVPELVEDGITGIVAKPTAESVAAAIRRFYSMPESQVRAMVRFAADHVVRTHGAARLVRVLKRVWQNRTIDILIVSWNELEELRAVIERVVENTSLPYHLIVCDNQSSKEPVAAYLDWVHGKYDRVTVIHNDSNAMVGPGTNRCLEHGISDYAIYVCGREGFSFSRGWEIPFVHTFEENPKLGLAGTLGRSPTYMTGKDYPSGIALFDAFRNKDFAANNKDRDFYHIQGGLFGIRRSVVDKIGGFSYDVPHSYTDVEYSYFVESEGWELGEVPGLLALFNKSRPTLRQRFDERVTIAHPVLLKDLALYEGVKARKLKHCNICDWFGSDFVAEQICPSCEADSKSRTLYRWLSDTFYMYRRLPALAVGLEGRMLQVWKEQFQGPRHSKEEFLELLRQKGRLQNRAGGMSLAALRLAGATPDEMSLIFKELKRLMVPGGKVLLQLPPDDRDFDAWLSNIRLLIEVEFFDFLKHHIYVSSAIAYSCEGIIEFQQRNAQS
ncbi:glycosyltransferase [Roseixanthobacter pseudopolyaromaticivorans]